MKRKYFIPFLLLLVFAFLVSGTGLSINKQSDGILNRVKKYQAADSVNISFGFADSSGQYLLASEINQLTKDSYYVVISSGKIFKLDFIEEREEKEESTGRQTKGNFNNSGGFLFKSLYIKLNPGKTYLIANSDYLTRHSRLSIEPDYYAPLNSEQTKQIESAKGKEIKSGWQIGKTDEGIILALVLFRPNNDTALASLVLMKNGLSVFNDYPGNLNNENSVWRADDNGEFNPQSIDVIALFHSPEGYEIARTWAGEEGENSVFLVQQDNVFKPVKDYYRYWTAE